MFKYTIPLKSKGVYFIINLFALFIISCNAKKDKTIETPIIAHQLKNSYVKNIENSILYLDSLEKSNTSDQYSQYYLKARKHFKLVEPLMSFLEVENYKTLNGPNILKVEEEDLTSIKIMQPHGFQVLEETIYTDSVENDKLKSEAAFISKRLTLISKNTNLNYLKNHHHLWIIRDGFVRIALTGITGFDSPILEQSLEEASYVYQSLTEYIKLLKPNFKNQELFNEWISEFTKSIEVLNEKSFSDFNRYNFIKNHTHHQLSLFNRTVEDWGVEFPFTLAIQNNASSLFSETTFNQKYFTDKRSKNQNDSIIALGNKLFNDSSLSSTKTMSCATCHHKNKAFTDGLAKSKGQTRNSPTLTYAGLQQGFFYDKRAGSLEGQIISVVNSETEFHGSLNHISKIVSKNVNYAKAFKELYKDSVTNYNVRNSIAQYIRSLSKFNSKFDNNINGISTSITQNEINGFNLFMGKAKCATCHFTPIFNGTIPPNYKETEMELLGVPQQPDTINAIIDADLGRYTVFKTEEKKFFFKTPTVRNIKKTAPYMHNGVYNTLEEVLDFYNRGGGAGIGIDIELQTLPPAPLNLTEQEMQDIIGFMKSLTDSEFTSENTIIEALN